MILFCGIRYIVKSNRESGNGRSDIIIREYQLRKLAVIIEIKVAEKFSELDKKCDDALQQIEDRNNEVELIDECYQNIIKYGVAFYHKSCKIKSLMYLSSTSGSSLSKKSSESMAFLHKCGIT